MTHQKELTDFRAPAVQGCGCIDAVWTHMEDGSVVFVCPRHGGKA